MRGLDAGYAAEVNQVIKDQWHGLLQNSDDATFYQTPSYRAAKSEAADRTNLKNLMRALRADYENASQGLST